MCSAPGLAGKYKGVMEDMPPLYITTQGARLCYRGHRLIVEYEEREVAAVPAVHVSAVYILGNVSVTTPALAFLLQQGIDLVFLTLDGRYRGRLVGPEGGNVRLRLSQYRRATEPAWALATARAIVAAKLHNYRTLLRRYARRLDVLAADGAAVNGRPAEALVAAADELDGLMARVSRCTTVAGLSGLEGRGTAVYYSVFHHLLRASGWTFERRTRRPPRDPINALLSFGYTILTRNLESALRAVGLDPYLGFLHQIAYNRPSLALDLAEEFRAVVVDSVVLRCVNNGIIIPGHFRLDPEAEYPVLLNDQGRERFIRELEARFNLEFRHPDSEERVTYRRCLELQARRMAQAVQDGSPYRPFQVR